MAEQNDIFNLSPDQPVAVARDGQTTGGRPTRSTFSATAFDLLRIGDRKSVV